jgi:hypothetical protein
MPLKEMSVEEDDPNITEHGPCAIGEIVTTLPLAQPAGRTIGLETEHRRGFEVEAGTDTS